MSRKMTGIVKTFDCKSGKGLITPPMDAKMFRSTFQHVANTKQKRLSPVYALSFVVLMASADLPPPTFIFHNSSLGIFSEKFSEPVYLRSLL
ncbi:cold shock-like protein CspF [Salmonella enterica subsp. enterica]|uniref:Cold shock-like protein CspF n=1 Tax=Salmonella enterica I TaxID=59201 RepID=A0A379WVJ7_SALET|nr:cold shock-like protein CspF [Salmonella enterica subsp. enterica]